MASAYRRMFFVHVTRNAAGKSVRRFVSKCESERLKACGEHVEERPGKLSFPTLFHRRLVTASHRA